MKKKLTILQRLTVISVLALLAFSCSGIGRATDIFTKPTAREVYEREFESPELFDLWKQQAIHALSDSISVKPPYAEAGTFFPKTFPTYSYELAVEPGERLLVEVNTDTDTLETLVFIDLYKQKSDSLGSFEHINSAEFGSSLLEEEISTPGIYKIVVQPEIEANTTFGLAIETTPVYAFPVSNKGNEAIHSYWGAIRDGGRRSHEGIDIFAPRGTPVVATTKGRVTRTGNRGLGGKQVWLRDSERGLSLYYAHLDSIIATPGMTVAPGDTLGLVGNTGNARTTPPHLHFGIYKGYSGAVNPLPYIYQTESLETGDLDLETALSSSFVATSTANLRTGPSTDFPVKAQLKAKDTIRVLGKSRNWYHIRNGERNSFVHESLVAPL